MHKGGQEHTKSQRYDWDKSLLTIPLEQCLEQLFPSDLGFNLVCSCQGARMTFYNIVQALLCFITCCTAHVLKLLPVNLKMHFHKTSSSSNSDTHTHFCPQYNINTERTPPEAMQHILRACPHHRLAVFINPTCYLLAEQSSQSYPGLAFFWHVISTSWLPPTPVGLHKTVKTSLHPLPSTSAPRTLLSTVPPARNSLPACLSVGCTCCVFVLHKSPFHRTVSSARHVFPGFWQ